MNARTNYVTEIVGSDTPHVPEGEYLAELEGVEKVITKFGDAFKWHWVLPTAGGFELLQMTSTATSPGSRAGKNVKALRGRGVAPNERLPMAEIVGQSASLELSIDPERGWNRVEDVQPARQPLTDTALEAYADEADRQARLGL